MRFSFALILSSGPAHAVTQAVVVNQKIPIENTGKRETGNTGILQLAGPAKAEAAIGGESWASCVFLSQLVSPVVKKQSGTILKPSFRKPQLFELSFLSL